MLALRGRFSTDVPGRSRGRVRRIVVPGAVGTVLALAVTVGTPAALADPADLGGQAEATTAAPATPTAEATPAAGSAGADETRAADPKAGTDARTDARADADAGAERAPRTARRSTALLGTPPPATPTAAATELIAWIGETQPDTLLTLQAALNAAVDGDVVHVLPGAWTWGATALSVKTAVTITAADETHLYGRFTMTNTSSGLAFDPAITVLATASPVVQVAKPGATLRGLTVRNPNLVSSLSAVGVSGTPAGITVTGLDFDNTGGAAGTSYGVITSGAAALTVRDSTIAGATTAIYSVPTGGVQGATISGVTISGATTGIYAASVSTDATVESSTIAATSTGISIGTAANATITDSEVSGASTGISFTSATGGAVTNTDVAGTSTGTGTGIALGTSKNVTVAGGRLTRMGTGVSIGAATDPTVRGVRIDASGTGVNVTGATHPTIDDCTITTNSRSAANGINLGTATGVEMHRNMIVGQDYTLARTLDDLTPTTQTLISASSRGILVNAAKEVEDHDSTVVGYYDGVAYAGAGTVSEGLRMTGTTVRLSRHSGFWLGKVSGVVLDHVTVHLDGFAERSMDVSGINVQASPGPQIIEPQVTGSARWGVFAPSATVSDLGLQLTGGDIYVHEGGIGFGVTTGARVTGTTVHMLSNPANDRSGGYRESHGINFDTATDTVITGARIVTEPGYVATRHGMYARANRPSGYANTTISDCYIEAASYGVEAASSSGLTIENTTFAGAGQLTDSFDNGPTMAVNMHRAQGLTVRDSRMSGFGAVMGSTTASVTAVNGRPTDDVTFTGNTATGNPAGVSFTFGAARPLVAGNTFTGLTDYAVKLAPAHNVTIRDNRIAFDGTNRGAVWVSTENGQLESSTSYSSSGIAVTGNTFTGTGAAVLAGSNDATKGRRALRDTITVARNTFIKTSTAVQVWDNAAGLVGTGGTADSVPTNNQLADGAGNLVVAVDARDGNVWGSPCGPMVASDRYRGRGAPVVENGGVDGEKAQVLYPTCDLRLRGPVPFSFRAGWGSNPFGALTGFRSAGVGAGPLARPKVFDGEIGGPA